MRLRLNTKHHILGAGECCGGLYRKYLGKQVIMPKVSVYVRYCIGE